jgi:hypothetical protein
MPAEGKKKQTTFPSFRLSVYRYWLIMKNLKLQHLLGGMVWSFILSACAGSSQTTSSNTPQLVAQLTVNSLLARQVQEQGILGAQEGDELTLVYSLKSYDGSGNLLAVNNGFWGTRTILEGTTIPAGEFDKISVRVPADGKIIAALSLIEIDDYKGERRIGRIRSHTKAERQPKALTHSTFAADQHLPPLQLIGNALRIAGYRNFNARHLNLSLNDDLGGDKKLLEGDDLTRLQSKPASGQSTLELDGKQVNESYFYVLKYNLEVSKP